jgi:TatD DNase family protein
VRAIEWVDTHCHIDDERIPGGTAAAVSAAREAGVRRMITVGTDAVRSAAAIGVARSHHGVFATVGLHPHDAVEGLDAVEALLASSLAGEDRDRIVAIGECGLDYHYDHSPRDVQREVFARQVALARRTGLPLVVHTREAWDDTFDILRAEGTPERTVFHCFTGGRAEAERCVELGAFVSFSGIVTFKGSLDVQEAAAWCPEGHLLVETDSPYLAPVPHRGRPNQPAYVPLVGAVVASLRNVAVADVAAVTTDTAHLAFPGIAP